MNSAARQWTLAPSILSLIWCGLFLSVDYDAPTHTWWNLFVLTPQHSILCTVTTTFFHANLAHVLSNVALAYTLSFGIRDLLDSRQMITLWLILAPTATLVSFLLTPGSLVGASAGLMGVLGGALSLALSGESKRSKKWLILGCVAFLVLSTPGDRIAHVSGFFLGYGLSRRIVDADAALHWVLLFTTTVIGWLLIIG